MTKSQRKSLELLQRQMLNAIAWREIDPARGKNHLISLHEANMNRLLPLFSKMLTRGDSPK